MRNIERSIFAVCMLVSMVLIFVASEEPIISLFANTWLQHVFVNAVSGNSIVFNLSIGIFVSCVFYIIVVYIPEQRRQRDFAPEIQRHVEQVIGRTNSIISKIHNKSGKSFDLASFTKEELVDACKLFNPKDIPEYFHSGIGNTYTSNFAYGCYVQWTFVLEGIDGAIRYLPFVDTGLINILHKIRNCSFTHAASGLQNFERLKNTDMAPWAPQIYELYELTLELSEYYGKYVKKGYTHPSKPKT
ncbi:hypothetical protein CGH09_23925 [Vibrio parahaemolyticus]|nr:hypothetical protein [Vibrio vulnificus]ELI3524676.1 hypothetical protein [Vibrio vulnificus]TOP73246.1 hypothetical protein CGH09_23925 [Vibrio parahaemolyticus]HDY7479750.1 hypothetical protein [Vibrio vulnificus]